jgi:(S)-ureidoglycine-glyoxylate aminotransferase
MHNVVAVRIPDVVDGDAVRGGLLDNFGIEIGTSFGPLHGVVWRIGTMGFNARRDAVLTTLAALEHELRRAGFPTPPGGGVSAALASYETERERGYVPVGTRDEHNPVLADQLEGGS